jgi:hypothetical protein
VISGSVRGELGDERVEGEWEVGEMEARERERVWESERRDGGDGKGGECRYGLARRVEDRRSVGDGVLGTVRVECEEGGGVERLGRMLGEREIALRRCVPRAVETGIARIG